jgi:hypothetical protein
MSGKADANDDEILSAYLDEELSLDDARRLKDRLAREPALALRLEEMQSANLAARGVFEAADDLPLPQSVLDLLNENGADNPRAGSDEGNVARFPARGLQRYFQAPVALAASVALAAGFLAGDVLHRTQDADAPVAPSFYADAIPQGSELHDFLETGASGTARVLPSGASGRLMLTFENRDGDWCRQFELAQETGSMQALACRGNDAWHVEALAYAAPVPTGSHYQAAASGSLPALDTAVDEQIGTGAALGSEEESLLISNGWRMPDK